MAHSVPRPLDEALTGYIFDMIGWIKLHRQIIEWEWYTDPVVSRLFIHLILKSNHDANRFLGRDVMPGQVIIGRISLASELRLTEKQIRRGLEVLEQGGEIIIERASRFSVVTICKWASYQAQETTQGPAEVMSEGRSKGQQRAGERATNKNDKNIRNKEDKNTPKLLDVQDKPEPRPSFKKPLMDEVLTYMRSLEVVPVNYKELADEFLDYYESNGWKVGKNPMKDWKSSVRNWIRNDKKFKNGNHNNRKPKPGPLADTVAEQMRTGEWANSKPIELIPGVPLSPRFQTK